MGSNGVVTALSQLSFHPRGRIQHGLAHKRAQNNPRLHKPTGIEASFDLDLSLRSTLLHSLVQFVSHLTIQLQPHCLLQPRS